MKETLVQKIKNLALGQSLTEGGIQVTYEMFPTAGRALGYTVRGGDDTHGLHVKSATAAAKRVRELSSK